jgi:hypothetical protein
MNKSIFNECFYKAYGYHSCPTGDPELQKFFECVVKDVIQKTWDEVQYRWTTTGADFVTADLLKRYGIEE